MTLLSWPEALVLCVAILALAWVRKGSEAPTVNILVGDTNKVSVPPDDDERYN